MPQTRSRLFDDFSRLMTDAAGLAEGARREVETLAKSQLERLMAGMDFVSREEFDAVREMAASPAPRTRSSKRASPRSKPSWPSPIREADFGVVAGLGAR